MLTTDLQNWFIDLLTCFSVLIFVFCLKVILSLSKRTPNILKPISKQFISLLNNGQISLLTVTYCIVTIRSIASLRYIERFNEILIVLLTVVIIINFLFYILIKEIGTIEDETTMRNISIGCLVFSIISSLAYTITQALIQN